MSDKQPQKWLLKIVPDAKVVIITIINRRDAY